MIELTPLAQLAVCDMLRRECGSAAVFEAIDGITQSTGMAAKADCRIGASKIAE